MNSLKNISNSKKSGFTFVELLFAIVVMGTMFGLALTVFIGMLRFYVFANSVRQNQENSRNILDTISRDIKFGKLLLPASSDNSISNKLCVYSPETNRTVLYERDPVSRKLYKYTSSDPPFPTFQDAKNALPASACSKNASTKAEISLSNTQVIAFETAFVGGASTVAYLDVASVTIKFVNITGRADGDNCMTSDIYCNKLTLNSAINIRGGD